MSKGSVLQEHLATQAQQLFSILGTTVAFDAIIKGTYPFPKNMLINSTFGT